MAAVIWNIWRVSSYLAKSNPHLELLPLLLLLMGFLSKDSICSWILETFVCNDFFSEKTTDAYTAALITEHLASVLLLFFSVHYTGLCLAQVIGLHFLCTENRLCDRWMNHHLQRFLSWFLHTLYGYLEKETLNFHSCFSMFTGRDFHRSF